MGFPDVRQQDIRHDAMPAGTYPLTKRICHSIERRPPVSEEPDKSRRFSTDIFTRFKYIK